MDSPPDRTANVLALLTLGTILVFAWNGEHKNDKAWNKMVDQIEDWTGLKFSEPAKKKKPPAKKSPTKKTSSKKKPDQKKSSTDKKGAKQPSKSDDK